MPVQFKTDECCCFIEYKEKFYEICNVTLQILLPSFTGPSKSTIYSAKDFLLKARKEGPVIQNKK